MTDTPERERLADRILAAGFRLPPPVAEDDLEVARKLVTECFTPFPLKEGAWTEITISGGDNGLEGKILAALTAAREAARAPLLREIERLKQHLSAYEIRIPMAAEHLAKLPQLTGDYETDLAAMADAITDEMLPAGPPTWGFVHWEISPPDEAFALFSLEAGLIKRAASAEAALKTMREALTVALDIDDYDALRAALGDQP